MVGAKRALKPQQIWAIRFWLDRGRRLRDRALFDLAIDSKLRSCDAVKIRIGELVSVGRVRTRATVTQQKTGRPVQSSCSKQLAPASRLGLNTGEGHSKTMRSQAAPTMDTVREVGVRQLIETAAATSASAASRPSGDVAALARYFRSVPLISAAP
jgi:hypothetical protein